MQEEFHLAGTTTQSGVASNSVQPMASTRCCPLPPLQAAGVPFQSKPSCCTPLPEAVPIDPARTSAGFDLSSSPCLCARLFVAGDPVPEASKSRRCNLLMPRPLPIPKLPALLLSTIGDFASAQRRCASSTTVLPRPPLYPIHRRRLSFRVPHCPALSVQKRRI